MPTIISHPPSKEYSDGWDRIFAPKPPVKWGVVVASSIKGNKVSRATIKAWKGKFCVIKMANGEWGRALFDTRKEARAYAKEMASHNGYWHYSAKKYTAP